jgi:hypothetical protein
LDVIKPSQIQQHVVTKNRIAPTMQTTNGADALASVLVENLQNFLLVGWGVGR